MAEAASKTPPYVPSATAASLRMAGSVMGRVGQLAERVYAGYVGESPGPAGLMREPEAQKPPLEKRPGEQVLAIPPRDARGASDAEASAAPSSRPERPLDRRGSLAVLDGWQPSEVVRAGLRAREAAESAGPLFCVLPPAKLAPVVAAMESALGAPSAPAERPQSKEPASSAPNLTLLHGEGAQAGSRPSTSVERSSALSEQPQQRSVSKAAMDASAQLLQALRTHAAAQASAGTERVSLGDMTQIAFAASEQQLAAASSEVAPRARSSSQALGPLPNSKILNDQRYVLRRIREIANTIVKELQEHQIRAANRFGHS